MKILFITILLIGFLKSDPVKADAGISVAVAVLVTGLIVATPFLYDEDEETVENDEEIDEDGFFSDELGRNRIEFIKIDQKLEKGI